MRTVGGKKTRVFFIEYFMDSELKNVHIFLHLASELFYEGL